MSREIVTVEKVPVAWASGEPVSREDRIKIALLRLAGCSCELPLIRHAYDEHGKLNDGVRCKVCGTMARFETPTVEDVLAWNRRSHQMTMAFIRENPGAFDGWVSECFDGCGCELSSDTTV